MKRVFRGTLRVIAVVLIIAVLISIPTVVRGYQLYRDAVKDVSIEKKVAQIKEDQDYVPLNQMSGYFKESIIKSEDKRFRYHIGFDPVATTRALYNDLKAGAFVEGGSTITQQLAKNMYFDFDKNLERKVAEIFVAFNLEMDYTKDEILEMYCNFIYYGEGCYGIKEAAAHYYGETPSTIETHQADDLVYTIKCPNYYNPNV